MLGTATKDTARSTGRNTAMPLSKNEHLLRWVEKMAELAKPTAIHWVDGSLEENDILLRQMVASGTLTKLNDKLWPGCYYARSDANDVSPGTPACSQDHLRVRPVQTMEP